MEVAGSRAMEGVDFNMRMRPLKDVVTDIERGSGGSSAPGTRSAANRAAARSERRALHRKRIKRAVGKRGATRNLQDDSIVE
jgi:hypothetical protein